MFHRSLFRWSFLAVGWGDPLTVTAEDYAERALFGSPSLISPQTDGWTAANAATLTHVTLPEALQATRSVPIEHHRDITKSLQKALQTGSTVFSPESAAVCLEEMSRLGVTAHHGDLVVPLRSYLACPNAASHYSLLSRLVSTTSLLQSDAVLSSFFQRAFEARMHDLDNDQALRYLRHLSPLQGSRTLLEKWRPRIGTTLTMDELLMALDVVATASSYVPSACHAVAVAVAELRDVDITWGTEDNIAALYALAEIRRKWGFKPHPTTPYSLSCAVLRSLESGAELCPLQAKQLFFAAVEFHQEDLARQALRVLTTSSTVLLLTPGDMKRLLSNTVRDGTYPLPPQMLVDLSDTLRRWDRPIDPGDTVAVLYALHNHQALEDSLYILVSRRLPVASLSLEDVTRLLRVELSLPQADLVPALCAHISRRRKDSGTSPDIWSMLRDMAAYHEEVRKALAAVPRRAVRMQRPRGK